MKSQVSLMLDSGAFGAWKRGLTLDIDKYIQFIKDNRNCISTYVSLDVIPGSMGQMSKTQSDFEKAASVSQKNHLYMRKKGLAPIPVFHQGEDFKWLKTMLADGELYIGISPALTSPINIQRGWYDQVYTMLTDSKGRPIVKTHGFGVTNINFLKKYPFFTADSTTWAIMPSYGRVLIPKLVKGKWSYLNYDSIILSDILVSDTNRFEARGKEEQDHIIQYLETQVGVSMFEARNDPEARRFAVLHFFRNFQDQVGEVRFEARKGSFTTHIHDRKFVEIKHPTIIFATGTHSNLMNETLNRAKVWNRLLSYFELQAKPREYLVKYVKDGVWKPSRKARPKQTWDGRYRKFRQMKLLEKHRKAQDIDK